MNKRINKLIKQSYLTVRSHNDRDVTYFSQEKFAELIVRECLLVTKKQYDYTLPWGGVEDTIKEHFGVEE